MPRAHALQTVQYGLSPAPRSRGNSCLQIATYKVRTVRVLEESRMTDSANENSGHISKSVHSPPVPNLSTSSVRSLHLALLQF